MELIYPANIRFPMERANSIQVVNTCHALARIGVKTHLLVRRMDGRSDEACLAYYGLAPHPKLVIHRLPTLNTHRSERVWNRSFQLLALASIMRLGMRRDVRAILLRETGLTRLLIRAKPLLRAKIVFEMHTIEHMVKRFYHELMSDQGPLRHREEEQIRERERQICECADGIVFISDALRRMALQELGTPRRSVVVHDAAAPAAKATGTRRSGVVYVGQLYPWKGVDILIRAMKDVADRLTIVGGLPYENDMIRLKGLAQEVGVEEKVDFVGFVPPSKVAGYLASAQAAVLPLPDNVMSRHFTSPLKLFEYMAHGVPIVASDLPTVREILTDGKDAVLVKAGDPKALAEGIRKALEDPRWAARLSAAALRRAGEYTWEARAVRLAGFVRGLLRDEGRSEGI